MQRRTRWSDLGPSAWLLAPLVIAGAVRWLSSAAPEAAVAEEAAPPMLVYEDAPPASAVADAVTEDRSQHEAVLAWLAARGPAADSRSPMEQFTPVSDVATPEAHQAQAPASILILGAVIGTGEHALASVNGRVYRVGDTLPDGQVIRQIDASRQFVELAAAGGRVTRLTRDR